MPRKKAERKLKAIPVGECFPWALQMARAAFRERECACLVHAMVFNSDPGPGERKWYEHAWVEKDGMVYDWQTIVLRGGEPIPMEEFYATRKPRNIVKYDPERAIIKAIRTRNYGPWD